MVLSPDCPVCVLLKEGHDRMGVLLCAVLSSIYLGVLKKSNIHSIISFFLIFFAGSVMNERGSAHV